MSRLGRRSVPLIRLLALGAVLAFMAQPGFAGSLNDGEMDDLRTGLKAANPQPDTAALKPGLAVSYHMGRFQTLAEMMGIVGHSEGDKGKPLPMLNYKGDEGTQVMTSDRHDMVGAIIQGFIKFPRARNLCLKGHVE